MPSRLSITFRLCGSVAVSHFATGCHFLRGLAIACAVWSLVSNAHAAEWVTNVEQAQAQAAQGNKDLLMNFTGSGWCHWCIQLEEEVFGHDEFQREALKHFVLVELDFPMDPSSDSEEPPAISKETQAQNEEWYEKLGVEGFPSIYLADAQGRPYAKTGYQAGGPESYLVHLAELREIRKARDANFAQAKQAAGLEKARLLNAGLAKMDIGIVMSTYTDEVEQILALDADNQAGLRDHYQREQQEHNNRLANQALHKLVQDLQTGSSENALQEVDALLAKYQPTGEIRFNATVVKLNLFANAKRWDDALAIVEQLAQDESLDKRVGLQLILQKANLLSLAKRFEEALASFDQALQSELSIGMVRVQTLFGKAQVLRQTGDLKGAVQAIDQAIETADEEGLKNQLQLIKQHLLANPAEEESAGTESNTPTDREENVADAESPDAATAEPAN